MELYKRLGALTRRRDEWEANIPFVSSLLKSDSVRIKAKALWLLGEMGLAFPGSIMDHVPMIASFCNSQTPILRERAICALGRIGRGNYRLVEPFWEQLFRFACDEVSNIRLSFIWASENIAVNTPEPYRKHMAIFAQLLDDPDDRVRMEAPEMFRVLGKQKPAYVEPYIAQLRTISENDTNRIVRIHCLGAIKAAGLK